MSIPYGISYNQNLDGTYDITYYDPSNPPTKSQCRVPIIMLS